MRLLLPALLSALLGAALPWSSARADAASGAPYSLNMKDVDIGVLIATVSEITGKTFIVDGRVKGLVNVSSTKAASKDELYQMFLSILRVNGFVAIDDGSAVRILPEAVAAQDGGVGLSAGASGDEMTTRVLELKHLNPNEIISVLRPLIPQTGQMLAHPPSNSIIVSDRVSNVQRLEAIVRRLDVASQSEIEVVSLGSANAAELVRTLTQLNAGVPEAGGKIAADERTNSIILSGDRARRLRMKALIAVLDTPLRSDDSAQVIYLSYAKAEDVAAILDAMVKGGSLEAVAAAAPGNVAVSGGTARDGAGRTLIQAHKDTNALIISAPPAVFRALQDIVRKLDIRRAQVHIEAIIAEVTDGTAKELGVQWQGTDNDFGDNGFIGGTNFPGSNGTGGIVGTTIDPTNSAVSALGGSGLNIGYLRGTFRLPGSDRDFIRLGALAKALAADTDNNILSTPSTTVLDNSEALLSVGQEVPFLTGQVGLNVQTNTNSGTAGGGIANPFQTIERKEVGVKLKVTPTINRGDSVKLELELEASSIAPGVRGAVDLITNTRKVTSSVLVRDRGLLVIGGLSDEELNETEQRVPGLGRIPVLGNLFKYRSTSKQKRHLLMFLRPTIVRDSLGEDLISSEKYEFLRAEQMKARENASYLVPKEEVPVLPALELPQAPPEGAATTPLESSASPVPARPIPDATPPAAPAAGDRPAPTRVQPPADTLSTAPPVAAAAAPQPYAPVASGPRGPSAWFLKFGAYESERTAQDLVDKLARLKIDAVAMAVEVDGKKLYRVGSKPYLDKRTAEADARRAARQIRGIEADVIRRTGNTARLATEFGWVP